MPRSGAMAEAALLKAAGLRLSLPDFSRKPPFGAAPVVDILHGIDLELAPGDTLGIVGESGSGKSSLGRTLVRLHTPTAGRLRFDGQDITNLPEERLRPLRAQLQMIFQDSQSSLNPRHRVAEIVAQPLRLHRRAKTRAEARRQVDALLERVACGRPTARAILTSCRAASASASASPGPSPCGRDWWWPTRSSPGSMSRTRRRSLHCCASCGWIWVSPCSSSVTTFPSCAPCATGSW